MYASVVCYLRPLPADRAPLTPTCSYQEPASHWSSLKAFTPGMIRELITLRFIYLISYWEKRFDSTGNQNISLPKSCWPVQNYLWFTLHFKHYLKPQQGKKENMTAVCGKQALGWRLIRTSPLDNHLENHKKWTQHAETMYLCVVASSKVQIPTRRRCPGDQGWGSLV